MFQTWFLIAYITTVHATCGSHTCSLWHLIGCPTSSDLSLPYRAFGAKLANKMAGAAAAAAAAASAACCSCKVGIWEGPKLNTTALYMLTYSISKNANNLVQSRTARLQEPEPANRTEEKTESSSLRVRFLETEPIRTGATLY